MAKSKINYTEILSYAFNFRGKSTPKKMGEQAKNLLSYSFNQYEKLMKKRSEDNGFTYSERCFIIYQHLYVFLIMSDDKFTEEEYNAYKDFCDWARFEPLSVADFKNIYERFTIEDIYEDINELVELRDQIEPKHYLYMVGGFFYIPLISKPSIHEKEYDILSKFFEKDFDIIAPTYEAFSKAVNGF